MIEFQNKLEKNSQEIDRFLDNYLPSGNGLNSKLFEAMRYSSISGGKKIRAYLVLETGRFISAINNKTLEKLEIKKKDINFEYRFSSFQRNDLTIISARLHFKPNGDLEKLIQTTKNNLKLKTETQPYHQPSFGSVFKNPENNYAAKLIDDMGLKGFKIGGAEISTMHSNFIINTSSASSKDIYELITVIQQKVLQNKGIYLQPEVRMIGFDYPN